MDWKEFYEWLATCPTHKFEEISVNEECAVVSFLIEPEFLSMTDIEEEE